MLGSIGVKLNEKHLWHDTDHKKAITMEVKWCQFWGGIQKQKFKACVYKTHYINYSLYQ